MDEIDFENFYRLNFYIEDQHHKECDNLHSCDGFLLCVRKLRSVHELKPCQKKQTKFFSE